MNQVQFIERDGKREFAILPIELYEQLMESLEDVEDIKLLEQALAEDDGVRIPLQVVEAMVNGAHPIQAWRLYRGLTLDSLSAAAGVSKAYLSQIANRRRTGSVTTLQAIADALGVKLDDLTDDKGEVSTGNR